MEPQNIEIRTATLGDSPEMASVLYESFIEYKPSYTPDGFVATVPKAELIRNRFGEGHAWVALLGNEIVGTLSAVPRENTLYLRSMAVLPKARGYGIGRLLLDQAERYARENGFIRLLLSTTTFLDRAIRLYERFGFQRSDMGPHELFGTPLFTMIRELDPHN